MNRPSLALRSIDPTVQRLSRRAHTLSAAGMATTLRTLEPQRRYLVFEAEWQRQRFSGWLDVHDLLRQQYPDLHGLAWDALDEHYALNLLQQSAWPDVLAAPPEGWGAVRSGKIVPGSQQPEPLLCVAGHAAIPAFFADFPEAPPPSGRLPAWLGALPIVMECRLGQSTAPLSLLAEIEEGDLLLVQSAEPVVTIGGVSLCAFSYERKHIMLDSQINESDGKGLAQPPSGMPAPPASAVGEGACFTVGEIPVTLEFLLQEERLTVDELAELHPGAVLPLRDKAVERILIRANGQLLGRGELVQVGERLAVEVKSMNLVAPKSGSHGQ